MLKAHGYVRCTFQCSAVKLENCHRKNQRTTTAKNKWKMQNQQMNATELPIFIAAYKILVTYHRAAHVLNSIQDSSDPLALENKICQTTKRTTVPKNCC